MNSRNFSLIVLGDEKSKIRVLANSVSVENQLPSSQMAVQRTQMAEGEGSSLGSLL